MVLRYLSPGSPRWARFLVDAAILTALFILEFESDGTIGPHDIFLIIVFGVTCSDHPEVNLVGIFYRKGDSDIPILKWLFCPRCEGIRMGQGFKPIGNSLFDVPRLPPRS